MTSALVHVAACELQHELRTDVGAKTVTLWRQRFRDKESSRVKFNPKVKGIDTKVVGHTGYIMSIILSIASHITLNSLMFVRDLFGEIRDHI